MINYDEAIRNSIDSSFSKKGIVGVIVNVANGEVTLTGNVKRAELTKVMQAANESKPKKVYNKLTIK
jgi:osmotically-inducible protein OsmY